MKAAIISALLAGTVGSGIGSGVTYERMQHRQPTYDSTPYPTAVQLPRAKTDREIEVAAFLDGIKQLHEDAVAAAQIQQAMLEVLKNGTSSELAQAVTLDEHVLQIACLIKGCKPQALR